MRQRKPLPKLIQRERTKGWRLPPGTICVTRPGRWGNPFRENDPHPLHGWPMSVEETVKLFAFWLDSLSAETREAYLRDLRGHDLACFCDQSGPCHGKVLLVEANK